MEAAGQYFVAPDNGVLGMIFAREKHQVRLISNERYFRQPVSRTFHGRDIFAPVAAHVAAGAAPSRAWTAASHAGGRLARPGCLVANCRAPPRPG